MHDTAGRNAPAVADLDAYAADRSVSLRAVEMDVAGQASVDAAIKRVISQLNPRPGRLNLLVMRGTLRTARGQITLPARNALSAVFRRGRDTRFIPGRGASGA